jgi:beta-glucosidase
LKWLDNKRLRDFKKVFIESKSTKTIRFNIAVNDLFYVNESNEFTLEEGAFNIHVGTSSNNLKTLQVYIK